MTRRSKPARLTSDLHGGCGPKPTMRCSCLDVGLDGYRRYVGCGVMSYNLHVIGRELLARARSETVRAAA